MLFKQTFEMGLFRKKSLIDKLYDRHEQLLKEAHKLSTSNRSASDSKYAKAQAILDEIEVLQKQEAEQNKV